jgi:hypothetical protein
VILRAEHWRQQYEEDARYENSSGYYKYFQKENNYPEIRYWVKEQGREITALAASNNTTILRTSYRGENLELAKTVVPGLKMGLKGSRENQEDTSLVLTPFKEAETKGIYFKTEGVEHIDFIAGTDQQEAKYLDADRRVTINASRHEAYGRLNAWTDQSFRFGTAYREIQDTEAGNSEIMDVDYTVYPSPAFNTVGQYSLTSLKENMPHRIFECKNKKVLLRSSGLP